MMGITLQLHHHHKRDGHQGGAQLSCVVGSFWQVPSLVTASQFVFASGYGGTLGPPAEVNAHAFNTASNTYIAMVMAKASASQLSDVESR